MGKRPAAVLMGTVVLGAALGSCGGTTIEDGASGSGATTALGGATASAGGGTGGTTGGSVATGGASAGSGATSGASGGSANSPGGGGTGNSSSGDAGATGSGVVDGGQGCEGLSLYSGGEGGADCVGVAEAAETIPVDMYIMLDRSVSMLETIQGQTAGAEDQTRWDGVLEAVEQFVRAPEAAELGVGIQFFSASGAGLEAEDCDVSNYSTPAVPIGDLPDVGLDIVAAIGDTVPGGFTPTYPAVQGALEYAATSNPSRLGVVVLVTDGLPTQCAEQRISEIATLAEQAFHDSGVVTFVVGLAEGMWNLNPIAQAGDTGAAYIIQEGDVAAQLLDAILSISSTTLRCSFDPPEALTSLIPIDFDHLQMVYTPSNGEPEKIPRINNSSECANAVHGGWYYNNPANPTVIRVCPCTCDRFGVGLIEYRHPCQPRTDSPG